MADTLNDKIDPAYLDIDTINFQIDHYSEILRSPRTHPDKKIDAYIRRDPLLRERERRQEASYVARTGWPIVVTSDAPKVAHPRPKLTLLPPPPARSKIRDLAKVGAQLLLIAVVCGVLLLVPLLIETVRSLP